MTDSALSRRRFLVYSGAGVAGLATSSALGPLAQADTFFSTDTPVTLARAIAASRGLGQRAATCPIPLLRDGVDAADEATEFATFTVEDDFVLARGLEYYVIIEWGESVAGSRFGYNADYTSLVRVINPFQKGDLLLTVNHEYVSGIPWQQTFHEVTGIALPSVQLDASNKLVVLGTQLASNSVDIDDPTLTSLQRAAIVEFCRQAMIDQGASVVRLRPDASGRLFRVAGAAEERRITGISGLDNPSERLTSDGPAVSVFTRFNDDLLGSEVIGTYGNCSGATTPWGTVLTCEENFQFVVPEDVRPNGRAFPSSTVKFALAPRNAATGLADQINGTGNPFKLQGNKYGWCVEIDPARPTSRPSKRTALGRFRHENAAFRADEGRPLAVYMADDRRGGHVWKFVSAGLFRQNNGKPRNSALLAQGTLYVARINPDFTGQWIPLVASTPVNPVRPSNLAGGRIRLPKRTNPINVAADGGTTQFSTDATVDTFAATWPTLGSLYVGSTPEEQLGAILTDAFAAANAAGGTPSARPEDVEVHPIDKSVYIAFTDNTSGGDGGPDKRIFVDSASTNSRQYGRLLRIAESGNDPAATTFAWGAFVESGEPFEGGGGFAAADNLMFDRAGNMLMVTDMSTENLNQAVPQRTGTTAPGKEAFRGIFGSNTIWLIPTSGPDAGTPICVGYGPSECEVTGPTLTPAEDQLIASVQHPGEVNGVRGRVLPESESRQFSLTTTTGTPFTQSRTVPLGSNFPSVNELNAPPKPCVIGIRASSALESLARRDSNAD